MKIITTVVTIIVFSISLLSFKPVREKVSDVFWGWFAYQMDKEEAEREEQEKRHEVVKGRDTAYVWNRHYEIWNHLGEKHFGVEIDDASDNVLEIVSWYDIYKGQFYVVAKDGYAVVDRDNLCRIFLLTNMEEVESKYIEYLTSYEEFTEEEREHFDKMIKKQKKSLY